jgi:hypothetical protein
MSRLDFPDMTTVTRPRKLGRAEICHHQVTELESAMSAFRPGTFCPPGLIAQLLVDGGLVMSDTRMERLSNYEVVQEARGQVLIAGLGLGMILHPILAKPEVEHVTVVELVPDVISLIGPTLPATYRQNRWTLQEGDIKTWRPPDGTRYDVIYFDIWPDICVDYYQEMKDLVKAFRRYRRPGAWVRCWSVEEIRDRLRQEAAYGW